MGGGGVGEGPWGAKAKQGDQLGGYCKSSGWEGIVDHYVTIKKNEKGHTEKIFNTYLLKDLHTLRVFLHIFAEPIG